MKEQNYFCAYTDEPITRTDAQDIEHFNPTLKNTVEDNYENWFVVKHQWNMEKPRKWEDYQPILHPTAVDFIQRVVYDSGDYRCNNDLDVEASNLIRLLNLSDPILAQTRKKYIARRKSDIEIYPDTVEQYFIERIAKDELITYPRAILEEFGVDVLLLIEQLKSE